MKKIFILGLVLVIIFSLTGCNKTVSIDFPFEPSNVENVEMYRFIVPSDVEKKVITRSKDIKGIYQSFESISLKDKAIEPDVDTPVISFRFNLSDGTSYEIIFSSIAVKGGRIITTNMKQDFFTSADVGSNWERYDYEVVKAFEDELPMLPDTKNENQDSEVTQWDKIPMVMVNGKLYYDTGIESTIEGRCGLMDGKITSSVDGTETPIEDNQSNFGTGFEYQYGADNTIEIFMNEKWIVFEHREG
ncbi:MAG: hypothetical protein MR210_08790 [Erysipelotrichaceae bacterium]|nr:hypothetical protein [Erysipelotrichaceae bacterium]MDY5252028.1 hypothetical protein [Erysipelotrichaceae bacterium]